MRLLTSTDLALRVLMRLSVAPDAPVNTDVLARELVVSRNHLHKIVQFLTEAGYVRTIRGARGGAMLAKPANRISIGDVIRRNEQDQPLVECFRGDGGACTLLKCCGLRSMLGNAKRAFYAHLDQYTLADCLTSRWRSVLTPDTRQRPRRRASGAEGAESALPHDTSDARRSPGRRSPGATHPSRVRSSRPSRA